MILVPQDNKPLATRPDNRSAALLSGAVGRYLARPIHLADDVRRRQLAVFGTTGAGKSSLLETVMLMDIERRLKGESRRGFALVDPVGEISDNMKCRVAAIREKLPPELQRKLDQLVYIIDPTMREVAAAYDPYEVKQGETPEVRSDKTADSLHAIYHNDPQETVRFKRVYKHASLALITAGRGFPDLPRFLTSADFREEVLEGCRHPGVTQYFADEFPDRQTEVLKRVESTLNRTDLLTNPDVEEFLTGPSTFDLRKAIDDGAFVIFRFPADKLGPGTSYLLSALMVAEIHQAASGRLDLVKSARNPFSLILDEYQLFATVSLIQMVEGARKLGLELILSSQEVVGQPKDEAIRRVARKIAGTLIAFRVAYEDAKILQPDLLIPEIDQVKHLSIRYQKVPSWFGEYTERFEDPVFRSQEEIREAEIRNIMTLPDRCFWMRDRRHPHANLVETRYLHPVERLADPRTMSTWVAQLEEVVMRRVGRAKGLRLPAPDPNAEYMFPEDYDPYGW